jgi:hypothetical protein
MQSARKDDPELDAILGEARTEAEVNAVMNEYVNSKPPATELQPKLGRPERMRVLFRKYDPAMVYVRRSPLPVHSSAR